VIVTLVPKANASTAKARVRVLANEAPGDVPVDVTVTHNGLVRTLSTTGSVAVPDDDGDGGQQDN
jgi:hypothetical protein